MLARRRVHGARREPGRPDAEVLYRSGDVSLTAGPGGGGVAALPAHGAAVVRY